MPRKINGAIKRKESMPREIEDGKDEFADFWDTAMMHYSKMRDEKKYRTSWSIQEDHPIYRDEDSVKDSEGRSLRSGGDELNKIFYIKTILENGKFRKEEYFTFIGGNTLKEVWAACEKIFHEAYPDDDDHVFIEALHRTSNSTYELILGS